MGMREERNKKKKLFLLFLSGDGESHEQRPSWRRWGKLSQTGVEII